MSETNDNQTLNQKINKVISDIKKLNDQKAQQFGCGIQKNSSQKSRLSYNNISEEKHNTYQTNINYSQSGLISNQYLNEISQESSKLHDESEQLIDFIKRERKQENMRQESCKQYSTQNNERKSTSKDQLATFQNFINHQSQSNIKNSHIRQESANDDDLSSVFDLTSAKQSQLQQQRRFYEGYKQQYQSQTSGSQNTNNIGNINDIASLQQPTSFYQFYSTTSQTNNPHNQTTRLADQIQQVQYPLQETRPKESNKYENILAGAGSIFVDNQGKCKAKTIIDELKLSSSNYEFQEQTVEETDQSKVSQQQIKQNYQPTDQLSHEEVMKWQQINQRTEDLLSQERHKNQTLLTKLDQKAKEQLLIDDMIEQQDLSNQLKQKQIQRLSQQTAKLQKNLIKEQCLKENMAQRVNGYSNPAKLMNYIKMKKSIENSQFQNVNQYVNHLEAFNKLSSKQSEQEKEYQRTLLKKISDKNQEQFGKNNGQTLYSGQDSFSRASSSKNIMSGHQVIYNVNMDQQELSLKEKLENQRRVLRDFGSYYQLNSMRN